MIYQLTKITGDIEKIYEVPLIFFENALGATSCSNVLFPKWFIPVYNRCPGVKDNFETLFNAYKDIGETKQKELIETYKNSKDIEQICSNKSKIYQGLDKYDSKLRLPLKNLFEFLFNETIGTAIFKTNSKMDIDDHYTKFQEINNVHVCPFCGLETYTIPEFRRAEYDHYLPISIYPWLGVNFNNLVPMGDHCNGKKNANNILYSDYATNTRRLVWYPYEWIEYTVTLNCKKKPTILDMKGEWEVSFKATSADDQEKIKTWNDVFEIPLQFNKHISNFHRRFIEDFAHNNKLKGKRLSEPKLIKELKEYCTNGIGDVKLETMALLKTIWADYYINLEDKTQHQLLINSIAGLADRVKP
jgi:hypothetical protein